MDNQTKGTVVSVRKQWWLKVNTKMVRRGPMDGVEYTKRAWIRAGRPVPEVGSTVSVAYCSEKPSKAKLVQGE
ncbi:MAG: sugar ABC transporter permease [Lachnospiraceae bacterium]|nr:sugar ABC transporter permease [Lachnospiraceae bacterium]